MATIYIGIGSNVGDRKANCLKAVEELDSRGVRVTRRSGLYETEPWGVKDQPGFLNMVVEAETDLTPEGLLAVMKAIEGALGRRRTSRWGPREIDLDILLYDERIVDEPHLKIPHPHMHERGFVLEPLSEIAPELMHPLLKKRVRELLSRIRHG